MILNDRLVCEWGIDPLSCLPYERDGLAYAMKKAISVQFEDYISMISVLKRETASDIRISSELLSRFVY
jgi:hypothetical protein